MNKLIDYTGFKTKAFTVLEKASGSKWKVQCNKCGRIYEKTIKDVKNFQTEGCLACTPRISKSKENEWHLFIHYKGHARYKNRVFDLTYEQFKGIVHSNCFYCGEPPQVQQQLVKYSKNSVLVPLNSVDRIDSSKGYTIDNCVPCCKLCNQMKSNIDQETFLAQVEKIHSFKDVQRLSQQGVEPSGSKRSDS